MNTRVLMVFGLLMVATGWYCAWTGDEIKASSAFGVAMILNAIGLAVMLK